MQCTRQEFSIVVPSNLTTVDGRAYKVDAYKVLDNTKSMFRTLSIDIEHERSNQIGYINTSSLYVAEDNSIRSNQSIVCGIEEKNFNGVSPVLVVDEQMNVQYISALAYTKQPNFKKLTFKEIQVEKELSELKNTVEQLTEDNKKLLGALVEQRNSIRTDKINEMIAVDKNIALFKEDLLKKDDKAFDEVVNSVMANKEVAKKEELIEQDNSVKNEFTDEVSLNILEQLGVKL